MSNMEYEDFISQRSAVGYKSVHNCKYCPYFSKSMFLMRNHLRRHRPAKEIFCCEKNQLEMFYCRECDFKTELFMFLRKHLEEVHALDKGTTSYIVKNYICKKCSFQTYSLLHWLRHFMNNDCGNDVVDCKGYFKYLQTVNQFACDKCPYKSTRKGCLTVHIIYKHTPEEHIKWFNCDQCPYKTKDKYLLKRHKTDKHTSTEDIIWFKCDQCPYKAKRRNHLKVHKTRRHGSEEDINWFKCDQCSHRSKQKGHLELHKLRKHTLEKDIHWFQCDQCLFKTKEKFELRMHTINKHTSDENVHWLKCDQCTHKVNIDVT